MLAIGMLLHLCKYMATILLTKAQRVELDSLDMACLDKAHQALVARIILPLLFLELAIL